MWVWCAFEGRGVARGSGGLWVLGMAMSHDVLIDSVCCTDH